MKIACLAIVLLTAQAIPFPGFPPPTVATWVVVQHTINDHPAGCHNTLSCSITITSTGSGHYLIFHALLSDASGFNHSYSSVTNGGGTWTDCVACDTVFTTTSTNTNITAYNLTPSSGVTSLTMNVAGSASALNWALEVIELAWTGAGSVTFDTGGAANNACSGTSCTGVALTLTAGGTDFVSQVSNPFAANITAISGGAGYTAYTDFFTTYGAGAAGAKNTSTGTAPTWTSATTGDSIAASAIALHGG